jgi:hypothetical protein
MIKKLRSLAKKAYRKLFYPIIYSYPAFWLYDLFGRLSAYRKERKHMQKIIGYYPDLKKPKSFNEKVLYKKVYDRNPVLPVISDKLRVRDYIKQVLGDKEAERMLIPLLHVTDRPENIPFDTLSGEYIIKPNHASGRLILKEIIDGSVRYKIIRDKNTTTLFDSTKSRAEVIDVCRTWLISPYGFKHYEWAYQKIKRKIIIEKLLRDSSGKLPTEYKFMVFNGKCYYITVVYDRFINKSLGRYTPEWKYIKNMNTWKHTRLAQYRQKPKNLQAMIDISELLAKPFDCIRVDLYLDDNHIYFGELTSYTAGGSEPYDPISADFKLGSKWKIMSMYWK